MGGNQLDSVQCKEVIMKEPLYVKLPSSEFGQDFEDHIQTKLVQLKYQYISLNHHLEENKFLLGKMMISLINVPENKGELFNIFSLAKFLEAKPSYVQECVRLAYKQNER